MSGVITPILDTLLHQVLGKRVDVSQAREILEPIKPLSPGQAPRAVHSDSRLHAEQAAVARSHAGVGAPSEQSASGSSSSLAPASTTTQFSAAARSIADLLLKFPAPPSVVKPPAPLLVESGPPNAQLLATRLQHSIETSGLFYESHLARWYRGDIPRAALEREPQMQFQSLRLPPGAQVTAPGTGPGTSALAAHAGAGGSAQGIPPAAERGQNGMLSTGRVILTPAPGAGATPAPLAPMSPPAGAAALGQGDAVNPAFAQADMPVESSRSVQPANLELLDDALQGIVRHQLELMVTPALRWEGDLWSGVFMALMIQVPETLGEWRGDQEGGGGDEEEDPVWYSRLSLQLPRLGELDVQLHLRTASLSLTLESGSAACVDTLNAERDTLVERLHRCGFDEVRVSVLASAATPDEEAS